MEQKTEDFSDQPLGTLIVVVGLPGAGKTTYMNSLAASGEVIAFYDDFQGDAKDKSRDPHLSNHFDPLVDDLKQAKSIAVSDIRYCVPRELNLFLGAVLSAVPEVKVEFKYFDNDPEACKKNILARNRVERVEKELELIDKLSAKYQVPTMEHLSVYREV